MKCNISELTLNKRIHTMYTIDIHVRVCIYDISSKEHAYTGS